MTINGSRMSWLYNALGTIFNGVVRMQIEEGVADSLELQSKDLLDPLNKMGETYWPSLLGAADQHLTASNAVADSAAEYYNDFMTSEEAKRISAAADDVQSSVMGTDAAKAATDVARNASKVVSNSAVINQVREINKDIKTLKPKIKIRERGKAEFRMRKSRNLNINIKMSDEVSRDEIFTVSFGEGPLGFGMGHESGIAVVKRLNRNSDDTPMSAEMQGLFSFRFRFFLVLYQILYVTNFTKKNTFSQYMRVIRGCSESHSW